MLITIASLLAAASVSGTTPTAAPPAPPAAAPIATSRTVAPTQRVCFVNQVTGSMIRLRTCKQLQQWRAEGIDPFARN